MYNGIGLETTRGTGTNGYVQRNLGFLRMSREKPHYKTEDDIKLSEANLIKAPDPGILEHERLRKIELKCFELRELMTEQDYDEPEIDSKVDEYRQLLTQQMQRHKQKSGREDFVSESVDAFGRLVARETHQVAELQQEKNDRLKQAFGIRPDYVSGSAMMNNAKKAAEGAESAKHTQKPDGVKVEQNESSSSSGTDSTSSSSNDESDIEDKKPPVKKNRPEKQAKRPSKEKKKRQTDPKKSKHLSQKRKRHQSESSDDDDSSSSSSDDESSSSTTSSDESSKAPKSHATPPNRRHHKDRHEDRYRNNRNNHESEKRRQSPNRDRDDRGGHRRYEERDDNYSRRRR